MVFSLFGRSLLVLALLFGLLFAVLMGLGAYLGWNIYVILLIAIGVIGLQYFLSPYIIQWIYRINWVGLEGLDPHQVAFIEQTCQERRIPIPRIGMVEDGNPNAFTFGHFPADARLVVTRGLLEKLNPGEINAVIGHELGHIKHWDFVIMTVASLVPIIFYVIFRGMLSSTRGRGSRKNAGGALLVALVAFFIYIISQYIVLFLSRVREYYADEFSAEVTGDPNQLASGLVKIAYGLSAETGKRTKAFASSPLPNRWASLTPQPHAIWRWLPPEVGASPRRIWRMP
ncbi:Protease HtpX [subsurface metagenome]